MKRAAVALTRNKGGDNTPAEFVRDRRLPGFRGGQMGAVEDKEADEVLWSGRNRPHGKNGEGGRWRLLKGQQHDSVCATERKGGGRSNARPRPRHGEWGDGAATVVARAAAEASGGCCAM
jgi:hypothetical protein